jgi:hypothetical protein
MTYRGRKAISVDNVKGKNMKKSKNNKTERTAQAQPDLESEETTLQLERQAVAADRALLARVAREELAAWDLMHSATVQTGIISLKMTVPSAEATEKVGEFVLREAGHEVLSATGFTFLQSISPLTRRQAARVATLAARVGIRSVRVGMDNAAARPAAEVTFCPWQTCATECVVVVRL